MWLHGEAPEPRSAGFPQGVEVAIPGRDEDDLDAAFVGDIDIGHRRPGGDHRPGLIAPLQAHAGHRVARDARFKRVEERSRLRPAVRGPFYRRVLWSTVVGKFYRAATPRQQQHSGSKHSGQREDRSAHTGHGKGTAIAVVAERQRRSPSGRQAVGRNQKEKGHRESRRMGRPPRVCLRTMNSILVKLRRSTIEHSRCPKTGLCLKNRQLLPNSWTERTRARALARRKKESEVRHRHCFVQHVRAAAWRTLRMNYGGRHQNGRGAEPRRQSWPGRCEMRGVKVSNCQKKGVES